MVALRAYASDCRLFGEVELGDVRLTDVLNEAAEVTVRDARLESLADGHAVEAPEMTVTRDELCAVVPAGPRGDPARRVRTRMTRVRVDIGPYRVEGTLHALPAADPLGAVLRRPAWLPLTNATISYRLGSDLATDEVDTLIVNRELAQSVRPVEGEAVALRWEAVNPSGRVQPHVADPVPPPSREETGSPPPGPGAQEGRQTSAGSMSGG